MGAFFDSNILVYAFSTDPRSVSARKLLDAGGRISIQCLNEFASVSHRKAGWAWAEISDAIDKILVLCEDAVALDLPIHRLGRHFAEQYKFSVYDAMIVAAALSAGCDILYSEDMHDGLVIDGRLTIVNPFRAA